MIEEQLLDRARKYLTVERTWSVLEAIVGTHAPSQTVAYTRAETIRRILDTERVPVAHFAGNWEQTGNALLYFGARLPRYLFFAHADEISYLVGPRLTADTWTLVPYCKHLSEAELDAVALRYSSVGRGLEVAARGSIVPGSRPVEDAPMFRLRSGELQSGDRVIYDLPPRREGDRVLGNMDNAAGVAACVLAAIAIAHFAPETEVGFVFTDEEEGPAAHHSSFARGARRWLNKAGAPDVAVVVDGHLGPSGTALGDGARFGICSGQGAATVTPPPLFAAFRELVREMQAHRINIQENFEPISRGDDTALVEFTNSILLVGYPAGNRHFQRGPSHAVLSDLVAASQVIFCTALYLKNLTTRPIS
ncbi:MAG: M20/M25/M40 family metallo-hydrolase [Rudaea sp.]